MAVFISSNNFSGQTANVTLYLPTGYTKPYDDVLSTSENLGGKVMPFTYQADIPAWEYGTFSLYFSGAGKTCIEYDVTPPDGDGNVYRTIQIGDQIWMAENLKTKKLQTGFSLDNISQLDDTTWGVANGSSTKYWSYVNGDPNNTDTYGLLYNEYAVENSLNNSTPSFTNLCPAGWHAPTQSEIQTLRSTLGGQTIGGGPLKYPGTTYWTIPNTDATNSSGFSGLGSGYRFEDGSFNYFNQRGYWWTTTSTASWYSSFNNANFDITTTSAKHGLSVRCLKDY